MCITNSAELYDMGNLEPKLYRNQKQTDTFYMQTYQD